MLAPGPSKLRIVANQVRQLPALLNEVAARQTIDLLLKLGRAYQFAQDQTGVVDHDLIGIDNRRAGLAITEHLARRGSRHIAFVALSDAAATVNAREAGYREALYAFDLPVSRDAVRHIDPAEPGSVRSLMDSWRPDAIVCANDRAAGRLMHTLLQLGYAIPADVRLAGIDDVEYARLLPVPLTTLRQPTRQIGDAALGAMLDRIRRPDLPPRDIFLQCDLIVRASSGANQQP